LQKKTSTTEGYTCGWIMFLMFNLGLNYINSVTVTDKYRRASMRQKNIITQQFLLWKGKDLPTCEWLIIHLHCLVPFCPCNEVASPQESGVLILARKSSKIHVTLNVYFLIDVMFELTLITEPK
jgi:hypothetical protein